jgi:long-chain acyl-CoA synthetase
MTVAATPASAQANLASILDAHPAGVAGDDVVALVSRNRATTYGELRAQVAGARRGLRRLGVSPGDRVAIVCGTTRSFAVSYLAIVGIGAIAVPLNPQSPAHELAAELVAVEPVVAVVDSLAAGTWAEVAMPSSLRTTIVTDGAETGDQMAFDDLLATDVATADGDDSIAAVSADDVAVLLFTSGTAGAPKAAMLTHGSLLANMVQSQASSADALTAGDVVYGVLPLFHIFGLNVVLGMSLRAGATVVLVQRFDPSTALDSIAERGVTVIPGAPPLWTAFAGFAAEQLAPLRNVRLALSGAARLPEEVMTTLRDKCGIVIREGYGLTEASPVVTTHVGIEPKVASIGLPLHGVEVRLVDSDGSDVLAGDTGEIWVRGANVFAGYWHDPEATARVLDADGWLHTGDIAAADDDGYLFIVDRAKDLIIVSGFNVFPAEVEEVIGAYPGVAEVGVVGVPHPHTGEAVKAFVVPEPGVELDEERLIAHCADELARYKCPNKILFVDALPHGATGKVLRRELR